MQEYQSIHDRWGFLASWSALLRERDIRVRTAFLHDHTYRYKFEAIELSLDPSTSLDSHSREQLQATVEAVALISTALKLYPEAWSVVLAGQCGCHDFDTQFHSVEELVPRFVFDCQLTPRQILTHSSDLRFFRMLMDSKARSNKFHIAMSQLLSIPGSKSRVAAPSVPFKLAISLFDEAATDTHAVELVKALKQFHFPATARQWCYLEAISIDLSASRLSPTFIERAMQLAAEAPFVQIDKLRVDPREICCADEELHGFFKVFMPIYPSLHLDLGIGPVRSMRDAHRVFDPSRFDSTRITTIMEAVASTPVHLKTLNIGSMMPPSVVNDDHSQIMWSELFGTLLHPSAACTIRTLTLADPALFHKPENAALIHAAASASPGYKILQSLAVELTNADQGNLHAVIEAFGGGLRLLRVVDSDRGIETSAVSFIMKVCPDLVYLDIDTVTIDSMKIFYDFPAQTQLATLALSNVTLNDRSSLEDFFNHVANPQSKLGRTLGEFVLVRTGDPEDVWDKLVLSGDELSAVESALRSNGHIHTLQLDVEDTTPEWVLALIRRDHRQPAAARHAPLQLTNMLAFLSATTHNDTTPAPTASQQLSHDEVGLVFDFAAICTSRWIHVGKSFGEAVD